VTSHDKLALKKNLEFSTNTRKLISHKDIKEKERFSNKTQGYTPN
jgi:hypothetical protein